LKLNSSQLTAEYLDTVHSNGFFQTNFKATRIFQDSYTLIDHVLSNNTDCNIMSGSIVHDISDHFPVFYSCNDIKCTKTVDYVTSRNFSYDNMTKFRESLRNIRWHNVLNKDNVNLALDNFLDIFLPLFELHFRLTRRKINNRNKFKIKEFMTTGLLISRRRKNHLFQKQISQPTDDNVKLYKVYRNIYNSLIRKSKRLYYEDMLKKYKSKPKKLWEFLKVQMAIAIAIVTKLKKFITVMY
jgi:hypothetical protein